MIVSRYRIPTGLSLIGAGIVVAVVGYLGVSNETEVAFQLPYFASAAVGALILMGLGSTILLSAQLERDTERIEDLTEAVRLLSEEVARLVDELSPRRGRAQMRVVGHDGEKAPTNGEPTEITPSRRPRSTP